MELFQIKHKITGNVLFELKTKSLRLCVEAGIKENADLRHANLRSADLSYANLRYADIRYANLRHANLRHANLRYADLRSADLRSANLRYADIRSADLRSADLRSADLDFSCWPLWCGSLSVKIDDKQAMQLAYHTLATMSKKQRKKFLADPISFANKFHRIPEVDEIER